MKKESVYRIEHKILTLAKNAVPDKQKNTYSLFSVDDIEFEHWDFSIENGWPGDAWLARAKISSSNFVEAINEFRRKLRKIIPRIAFVSQSYITYLQEPFVVHKIGSDSAFFQNFNDTKSGGLMFMEKDKQALDELLIAGKVPEEFFIYWNDAVNTVGYCAKLLLIFSALEALVKKSAGKGTAEYWILFQDILGEQLTKDIFGTKEQPSSGLRHRLVHGEYFSPNQDGDKDYLDLLHRKTIIYFNKNILSRPLIEENVVNPQRNLYGGKSEWHRFIKKQNHATFELKEVLGEVKENTLYAGFSSNTKYEMLDTTRHNELLRIY